MNAHMKMALRPLYPVLYPLLRLGHRWVITPLNLRRNARKPFRQLEIGPGPNRIPDFETLNVRAGLSVDYVHDVSRTLPFKPETFDLIYASHVLEHMAWYQTQSILNDWVRTLKVGGRIEIWVPDGLKIAKAFVDSESGGVNEIDCDGWYRFNPSKDVCMWANGRIFSYGDGDGSPLSPNWHRALFSARHLTELMRAAGLIDVVPLDRAQVRGHDHGWINMGFSGTRA